MQFRRRKEKYTKAYIENEIAKLPLKGQSILSWFLRTDTYAIREPDKVLDVINIYEPICESPIEQVFHLAYELTTFKRVMYGGLFYDIYPQEEIIANGNRYIADFLFDVGFLDENESGINTKQPLKVVIECDGYDFHHANDFQVIRDDNRDYDLMKAGYKVMHFCGKEINDNPFQCAIKAYEFIDDNVEKKRGKNGRKKNVHQKGYR